MTFPIQIGVGGYAGLQVINRIENRQKEIISRDPVVSRQINYFKDRMEFINTAEELVNDHKLFSMALGAFGIEDQANNRGIIKKVLLSDLNDKKSFARRLPDKRILRMAEAFDFHGRANAYSREEVKFFKTIGIENAGADTKKEFLDARKKLKGFLDPYASYMAGIAAHYSAKREAKKIATERGDIAIKEAIENGKPFKDTDNVYGSIPGKPLRWDGQKREWYEILKDPVLKKMIKSTLELKPVFDYLPLQKQVEIIEKSIKYKLNIEIVPEYDQNNEKLDLGSADLFYQFRKEEYINRFFRKYAQSTKEIPKIKQSGLAPDLVDRIADNFIDREFERRVGLADETMRLALNARRELADFAKRDSSKKTLWFELLGNPPLRRVFETAFGFGSEYAKLDIDRQFKEFSKASRRLLGTDSFSEINKPKNTERLLRTYLARTALSAGGAVGGVPNSYSSALSILANGGVAGGSNPALALLRGG